MALASVVAIGLTACGFGPGLSSPTPSPRSTWVAIYGPTDGTGTTPPEAVSLELDGRAWPIARGAGNAVVLVWTEEPAEVRLFAVAACRVLASFTAPPGSATALRFDASGEVTREDRTGTLL